MDAREIVRRAAVAAVAVDGDDRVQASNEAFRCLVGTVPVRGEGLHASLKIRGTQAEVDVSTVIVLGGEGGNHDLVYFFSPIRRRRRADELIDRLLDRVPLFADAVSGDAWERGVLTPAQLGVLRHLANGKSTSDAAEALGISPSTVRTHVEHVLERTETHGRAEAVAWALRRGLL